MPEVVEHSIFPLEFHLEEVPLSLQARPASRERWKTVVHQAARDRTEAMSDIVWLDEVPLAVTIYYFPTAPMEGDIDNIVKPILDAMIGAAYVDDRHVERVLSQKFEPGQGWSFDSPSGQLSAALDAIETDAGDPSPVVYIRVDDNLSWRRL